MQNLAFQISLLQNPAHNLNVALAGAIIEVVSLVSPTRQIYYIKYVCILLLLHVSSYIYILYVYNYIGSCTGCTHCWIHVQTGQLLIICIY